MTIPDVSFILVNYHSEAFTRQCLESLRDQTSGVTWEALVVDNHSGLAAAACQAVSPRVRVLMNDRNMGYGMACHRGAEAAQGKYLYFLNNDVRLLNDAASILFDFMRAHPDAGLAGAALVDGRGRHTPSFDYFPTLLSKFVGTGLLRRIRPERFPRRDGSVQTPTRVDLVSGSSLFMPRALYHDLGGFDPQFFLYCEEEDLGLRVHRAGRSVYHVPAAKVMHFGGGSSRDPAALKREFYISYFKFYRKHYGMWRQKVLIGLTFVQFVLRFLTRKDRAIWRELLRWMARGRPAAESLRYAPGNLDGPAAAGL